MVHGAAGTDPNRLTRVARSGVHPRKATPGPAERFSDTPALNDAHFRPHVERKWTLLAPKPLAMEPTSQPHCQIHTSRQVYATPSRESTVHFLRATANSERFFVAIRIVRSGDVRSMEGIVSCERAFRALRASGWACRGLLLREQSTNGPSDSVLRFRTILCSPPAPLVALITLLIALALGRG